MYICLLIFTKDYLQTYLSSFANDLHTTFPEIWLQHLQN